MKLKLHQVTICAADCVTPTLAARAMGRSLDLCEFGDAILFADLPIQDARFRTVKIPRLDSRDAYSRFVLKDLPNYIETSHALIVQWDGYVLEPHAWSKSFLEYDFIGATWVWRTDELRVGNGGFSLRSQKLLKLMGQDQFPFVAGVAEDELVCRIYRPQLTAEHGIKFAPEDLAQHFAYERARPTAPSFGFHGLFNLWRHTPDKELLEIAAQLSPDIICSIDYLELLVVLVSARKFALLQRLYRPLKELRSIDEIRQGVELLTQNRQSVDTFVGVVEKVTSMPPLTL